MKGSAADILVRYLEQEGVDWVFGVPGGHLLALYDAIHRSRKVGAVLAKNEQGAFQEGAATLSPTSPGRWARRPSAPMALASAALQSISLKGLKAMASSSRRSNQAEPGARRTPPVDSRLDRAPPGRLWMARSALPALETVVRRRLQLSTSLEGGVYFGQSGAVSGPAI